MVKSRPVKLILGNDNPGFNRAMGGPDRIGIKSGPTARLTTFGWTAVGSTVPEKKTEEYKTISDYQTQKALLTLPTGLHQRLSKKEELHNDELFEMLSRQYEMEKSERIQLEHSKPKKIQDIKADEHLERNIIFTGNKVTAPVMWKDQSKGPDLVNNYKQALKMFYAMDKQWGKGKKTEKVKQQYEAVFKDWVDRSILEPVPEEDKYQGFYIPHHPIIRDDKSTSKVRPVLNCAAKFAGKSLNDEICCGTNPVQLLAKIFMLFRKGKFAFMADVQEMFLAVGMRKEDRRFHRVFIMENGDVRSYQFTVFPFGNACSPKVAITVTKQAAEKKKATHPLAYEAICHNTLIDDTAKSAESPERLIETVKQLLEVYESIGMNLRKFASNSTQLMSTIPSEKQLPEFQVSELSNGAFNLSSISILGMSWRVRQRHDHIQNPRAHNDKPGLDEKESRINRT